MTYIYSLWLWKIILNMFSHWYTFYSILKLQNKVSKISYGRKGRSSSAGPYLPFRTLISVDRFLQSWTPDGDVDGNTSAVTGPVPTPASVHARAHERPRGLRFCQFSSDMECCVSFRSIYYPSVMQTLPPEYGGSREGRPRSQVLSQNEQQRRREREGPPL